MSTITERNREVAYEMFAANETSERVASRIRKPVASVRALRANWTRNLPSTNRRRSSSSGSTSSSGIVTVRLNSTRIKNALASGHSVQLVIEG